MNLLNILQTSSSGLTAQRIRMNLISSNLANINTTRTAEGGPYKRKDAVFESQPVEKSFDEIINGELAGKTSGVKVTEIVDDPRDPILKFDPQHPDANEDGYVEMPNINRVEEMVNLVSAARSYEANVTAIQATKNMILKALEIGN